MPKSSGYFTNIFGRSPFRDLQRHIGICVEATAELNTLFEGTHAGNWVEVEASYDRLTKLEHQADELKREIRTHLPSGFFLPVARADLLDMLGKQDEIANTSRDIAGLVLGRKLQFPSQLEESVRKLVEVSVDTCKQTQEIINQLDELIDSSFKGPRARVVSQMIEKVEALERQTDDIVVTMRKDIFGREDDLPPVHVVFLYKTLDLLSELADTAEQVAHRVQLMLAK